MFEDLGNLIIGLETNATSTFHIEDRGNAGLDPLQTFYPGHQRLLGQTQAVIQQIVEVGLVAGLQGNARQVETDHPQIVAAFVDHLAFFLVDTEEATATHGGLEGAGDLDHLIVVEDIRIHALGGTLQRQLLDVVIGIAKLVVYAIPDGEDQFRENGGLLVLAKACDTIFQD